MARLVQRLAPLVLLTILFVSVLHARPTPWWRASIPDEPFQTQRCTWSCHNHGCRHRAVLPGWLTSDTGAFGLTIRALGTMGGWLSRDRAVGYGLANLLVYCVAWPVGTYALWLVVLKQRDELARRRRRHVERSR